MKGYRMDKTEITILPDPALEELNRRVSKSGSQTAAAEELDVSLSYLNEVKKGRRGISANLLKKMGFKRIVVHVPAERAPSMIEAIESAIVADVHVKTLREDLVKNIRRVSK